MDKLIELFCVVDDFCKEFLPHFEQQLLNIEDKQRKRPSKMSTSEILTLVIYFHQSQFRHFKAYYQTILQKSLLPYFPKLLSYNRMVEVMQSVMIPLIFFIHSRSKTKTGIYFIDSTTISVCHVKRANRNKVFKGLAKKSKSTMGWYYGFKLHLIINDIGEIIAFKITSSTTDDRKVVPSMANGLVGKICGDKGYISQPLFDQLYQKGLKLITRIKKNMKNQLMPIADKLLLRKRALIETVNDQLKNISQIEHSRHRNVNNFFVNLLAGIAAYSLSPKKPSLRTNNQKQLIVL